MGKYRWRELDSIATDGAFRGRIRLVSQDKIRRGEFEMAATETPDLREDEARLRDLALRYARMTVSYTHLTLPTKA